MRTLLISSFISLSCLTVSAQSYNTALGVKADWSNLNVGLGELSVKHFFNSPHAIDASLGFGRRYAWLHVMYEHNQSFLGDTEWYYGVGGDFGIWDTNYDGRFEASERSGVWAGIDGNLGIEYTFVDFPINLAFDMGPTVRLFPDVKLGIMAGFALRYAFR
ncbi:MAG: hypothetical protein ACI865_000016 [Flavobacteriaceae bacterium]|jgi:hypothetical protein